MLPVRDTRGAVDPIPPSLPDSVSLTFCIVHFVFVYMSLSVLALCPAVATPPISAISFPNAQWCTADAEVQVPSAENPVLPKMHSFKSDLVTMEVGMFRLMPGVLPSYSCVPVFGFIQPHLLNPVPN